MSHPIHDVRHQKTFVLGGNAIFTLQNETTGNRFTFRVRDGIVSVLTGSDNLSSYTDIGNLVEGFFVPSEIAQLRNIAEEAGDVWLLEFLSSLLSRNHWTERQIEVLRKNIIRHRLIPRDDPRVLAFGWLWGKLSSLTPLPANVTFHHAGRCGKCARLLTVPESIELGFGPECAGKVFTLQG